MSKAFLISSAVRQTAFAVGALSRAVSHLLVNCSNKDYVVVFCSESELTAGYKRVIFNVMANLVSYHFFDTFDSTGSEEMGL